MRLPPLPVTSLSLEQEFEMRRMISLAKKLEKEDLLAAFTALLTHNYCLKNTVNNLLRHWND